MKKSFSERCYDLLKEIPFGRVVTYREVAEKLKSRAYRAVGNVMKKNRSLIKIPCHRVVRSNGNVGGYALGSKRKIELLRKEGIEVVDGKVDLKKYGHAFT